MNSLRAGVRLFAIGNQSTRNYCSGKKLVDVTVNDKTGIATVTMQRPPVNGLNLELLKALVNTFTDLEDNKARGMIFTSACNTVFSAGLDITEMYKPDPQRVKEFWYNLQECWIKLYGISYPTAAAINGHAPAGGCLLACSCEYRVMVNNYTIGLNETQLGIVAPNWFIATFMNTLNSRQAELALTSGKLFKTDEALNVGLIDEVANDKADAIAKCENFFKRFAKVNPAARMFSKLAIRQSTIDNLVDHRDEDIEKFLMFVNMPQVQKGLGIYLEGLKKKQSA